jgi:hypothetical protein
MPKESHVELCRPTFSHSCPRGVGSREPSQIGMYRQVFIGSHRYAFSTPPVVLVDIRLSVLEHSQKAGRLREPVTTSQTTNLSKIVWIRTATDIPGVGKSYLDETNVGALLAEALTANVQAVLADETSRVGADAAVSTSLARVRVYKPRYSPAPTALRAAALAAHLSCRLRFGRGDNVPLAGALAVGPRTRIPDRLVRHVGWMCVKFAMSLLQKISIRFRLENPPKGILTVLAAERRGCRSVS